VRDPKGRIVGAIVAFQDISPIKEQEQLRDEFISAAAHELKSPVAIIKGYAQLIRQWMPGNGRPAAAVEVINTQTNRINRRVQEMLEVIRFRKARPTLLRERFDLGELTEQLVARMQTMTERHLFSLKREEPVHVEADRERIEEVLIGLLDNAITFSPSGGDIAVKVWTEEDKGLVSIADNGVGISKERQQYIFEPFYEAVPSGAPGYRKVVTLGLYLCKLTIDRHGGRIWLESEEGQGSTFYFYLPLASGDGNGSGT
jgi:signal transduction histidine kinase